MALAPCMDGRGTQEGQHSRIHSGNLTGARQQPPQPPPLPPVIYAAYLLSPLFSSITIFLPKQSCTCDVSCQAPHWLICLVPLDPKICLFSGLKVEERFCTAHETRFIVCFSPHLFVSVSDKQVRPLHTHIKNRVVTEKEAEQRSK